MSSPFVSVRGEKPHSLVATAPLGVFVDVDVIKNAPKRLISSGCGDLIAKITDITIPQNINEVKDLSLLNDLKGSFGSE